MIRSTDTVYISGPMTGLPFFNYFKFYAWAGMIAKEYGCKVLNPARHRDGMPYRFYMDCAAADILHATVIVLLDGWQDSRGVKFELETANMRGGIRVISEIDLLIDIDKRFSLRNPPQSLVVDRPPPLFTGPRKKPLSPEEIKEALEKLREFMERTNRKEKTR